MAILTDYISKWKFYNLYSKTSAFSSFCLKPPFHFKTSLRFPRKQNPRQRLASRKFIKECSLERQGSKMGRGGRRDTVHFQGLRGALRELWRWGGPSELSWKRWNLYTRYQPITGPRQRRAASGKAMPREELSCELSSASDLRGIWVV